MRLLILFLVFLSFPALAAGSAQPTKAQIAEALMVNQNCAASDMMRSYYDCQCISARFLDLRLQRGNTPHQIDLIEESQRNCANKPEIAGLNYRRCMTWAPRQRDDYERYCQCFANRYAESFARMRTDSVYGRENLMTAALTACDKGDVLGEQQARESLVDRLRKTGLYRYLFPGAETRP